MLERLACALGRKDEKPNNELAEYLASSSDSHGTAEIVSGLGSPDKAIRHDCIKVLYELGAREPSLIVPFVHDFLSLLGDRSNRMVWGAMAALASISDRDDVKTVLAAHFPVIEKAYRAGSVITVDCAVSVIAGIASSTLPVSRDAERLLIEHLRTCRPGQVAQHFERCYPAVTPSNAKAFREVIAGRMEDLGTSAKARVSRVLKKIPEIS